MTGKITIDLSDNGIGVAANIQHASTADKLMVMHALARGLKLSTRELETYSKMEEVRFFDHTTTELTCPDLEALRNQLKGDGGYES